jgi:hypothetical protein
MKCSTWLVIDGRPFTTQLPNHDDREQFLAGNELILAGIEAADDRSRGGPLDGSRINDIAR